jgi:ferredoxin--NADP+ reductase
MYDIKAMVRPWVVQNVRDICEGTYVLTFSKNGMNFKPGQHLVAGLHNSINSREYSIYSGADEAYLQILVREVEEGVVSRKLHRLEKGDVIDISGPYGFFMYNAQPPSFKKLVFLASGTGIAPFHSFVRTYPKADYTLIHGIRSMHEAYDADHYAAGRYITCTSRDDSGDFHGRLTSYLHTVEFDRNVLIYLCGNSNMILDAMDILEKKGFSQSQMYTEVYF